MGVAGRSPGWQPEAADADLSGMPAVAVYRLVGSSSDSGSGGESELFKDDDNGVTMAFSRPGTPLDNPFIESWRQDYDHYRPHSSLSDTAPALLARPFEDSLNRRNF